MTIEDEDNYQNSQNCWICNEKIDDKKVRDHCHITGRYRGPVHRQCNLKNLKYLENYLLFFII